MAFFLMPERLPKTRARSAAVMRGAESFAGPKRRAQSLAVGEVGTFAVCFIVCERGERERGEWALGLDGFRCVMTSASGFRLTKLLDARWAYRGRSAPSEIPRPNAHRHVLSLALTTLITDELDLHAYMYSPAFNHFHGH